MSFHQVFQAGALFSGSVSKEGKCSDGHLLGEGPKNIVSENLKSNLEFLFVKSQLKEELKFL